jgi:hypothetical protein
VADIGKLFLPSFTKYKIHLSWKVVLTQFLERVVVEALSVVVWVTALLVTGLWLGVFTGVVVASVVSKPHIVTRTSKFKRWCHISFVGDPVVSGSKKAVLQEDDRGTRLEILVLNPPDPESVSIVSDDLVLFVVETGR